ncbi:MAG: hypothetical protein KatS3mg101_0707 [Patescibacteria group bacterium]|nr:MAG: hypothetical protein KatS3mg101_0707 [Patescibacteria group bacterium]
MSNNIKKYVGYFIIGLIFVAAAFLRIGYFQQTGKDIYAYEKSAEDLLTGVNPYIWTLESYSNPNDPSNHGYAYLPLLLYIYSFFYIVSMLLGIPFAFLIKIPVLLADLGVGFLIVRCLYSKNLLTLLFALLFWFWNPYFVLKHNYVYSDPIPVFFSLLGLFYLEKDEVLAGVFLAVAVAAKPYSLIFLPLFLVKSSKPLKLLSASAVVGIALSAPFLKSWNDFVTYLRGAVFVHGERFVQGRPILYFISYYGKIELIRIIPVKIYAYASLVVAWLVTLLSLYFSKIKDNYLVAAFALLVFYFFTPVLNRTYFMWLIPIFAIAAHNIFSEKKILYFLSIVLYWTFYFVYLSYWKDGFHIWHP